MDSFLLFLHSHPIEVLVTPLSTLRDTSFVIQLPSCGFVLRQTINGTLEVQGIASRTIDTELLTSVINLVQEKYNLAVRKSIPPYSIAIKVNGATIVLHVQQVCVSSAVTLFKVIAKNKTLVLEKNYSTEKTAWHLKEGTVQDNKGLQKIIDALEAHMMIKH